MSARNNSVMASRKPFREKDPLWSRLEFFPTPPWATRALMEDVLSGKPGRFRSCWEPCAGLGHMSGVLAEYFADVRASDVALYPQDEGVAPRRDIERFDFLDAAAVAAAPDVDWVITNPPFSQASDILTLALTKARCGVALLLRIQWLEGSDRFGNVFERRGPTLVAPFVERVPMCLGGWDPDGSTATQYAWFVWMRGAAWRFSIEGQTECWLIKPGRRAVRTKPGDAQAFGSHVPGWIPPSKLKRSGRDQTEMEI